MTCLTPPEASTSYQQESMKTVPCFKQFRDSMKLFGAEQLSGCKLDVNDLVCRVRRLTVRSTDFVIYQEMLLNRCQLIVTYPNQLSPPFITYLLVALNLIHQIFTTYRISTPIAIYCIHNIFIIPNFATYLVPYPPKQSQK